MRKIMLYMMVSLDGFFEGPKHDLSWHNVDKEFNKFAIGQMKEVDLIIFGRRMYRLMESYWPQAEDDPKMSKEDRIVAHLMNTTPKIVISHTLDKIRKHKNWKNVTVMKKFDAAQIRRIKRQSGKEIWVGGPNLASSFVKNGLIDEFRFMVNPVMIKRGTPISKWFEGNLKFDLIKTKTFKSGNVMLYYKPVAL
ncbi:MAG TPA: dihydrofolate reductase family protein [Candidatus Acidoferrales bacterium]|nr:dihydrofolate reductase family protein [Candidatus Acidoferrales bacterium]